LELRAGVSLKILHVVPSFGFGGMEKIISAVIENTSKRFEHEILALNGNVQASEWIKDSRVKLVKFEKAQKRFRFFRSLYRCLRNIRPEILMTYNWGATDAIWLGRLAGIRTILHSEHGFNVEEGTNTIWIRDCIRFLVYRLSSKVIVVSHELEEKLTDRFLLGQDKVRRIPNGVDVAYYCPNDDERRRIRKSLGFSDVECVIGFSGRHDPVKNLDLLLDVFRCSNPHDYPFRLLIVGDGPRRSHLEARCQAEGLRSYVKFTGQQAEVLPYLRAMDVFLLTSLREQMPLTILEAMAVGMPIIATSVGELPYIVDDGIDGFIRDLNAPVEAFVQPLRSLLDASQRKKLGQAARQKVTEKFQIGSMVKEYAELIQEYAC